MTRAGAGVRRAAPPGLLRGGLAYSPNRITSHSPISSVSQALTERVTRPTLTYSQRFQSLASRHTSPTIPEDVGVQDHHTPALATAPDLGPCPVPTAGHLDGVATVFSGLAAGAR